MHKISPLLLGLIFLAPIVLAQSLSEADVKSLLARIAERRASSPDVRADFQEERTMHLLNKPIVGSGKIWFHAPNKFRREVTGFFFSSRRRHTSSLRDWSSDVCSSD